MINLLPPEEKEKLLLEQIKKLIIILGSAALIILVCLILILSSIKFYILAEVNSQKIILEQAEKKYQTPDLSTVENLVQKYNKTLLQLKSFYKEETYFSKALKTISEIQRPEGVYLTNLSLNRKENPAKIEVTVSGISDTRENLLLFKKNVEEEEKIKNSYFSPQSWISPKDVNFSLTFEIFNNGDQR